MCVVVEIYCLCIICSRDDKFFSTAVFWGEGCCREGTNWLFLEPALAAALLYNNFRV